MPQRAWVLLKSGRRINLLEPTVADWDDDDLALGLARTYRWGGLRWTPKMRQLAKVEPCP